MRVLFSLIIFSFVLLSCKQNEKSLYAFDHWIANKADQTERMIDIISHIYVAPPGVPTVDRLQAEHRAFYKGESSKFEMLHYLIADDGQHFFYIQRPARNVRNDVRGVGGKFYLAQDGTIKDFQEVFVTPMIPYDNVKEIGEMLFDEFVTTGNVESVLGDAEIVEFPDGRAYYSMEKLEWRYN